MLCCSAINLRESRFVYLQKGFEVCAFAFKGGARVLCSGFRQGLMSVFPGKNLWCRELTNPTYNWFDDKVDLVLEEIRNNYPDGIAHEVIFWRLKSYKNSFMATEKDAATAIQTLFEIALTNPQKDIPDTFKELAKALFKVSLCSYYHNPLIDQLRSEISKMLALINHEYSRYQFLNWQNEIFNLKEELFEPKEFSFGGFLKEIAHLCVMIAFSVGVMILFMALVAGLVTILPTAVLEFIVMGFVSALLAFVGGIALICVVCGVLHLAMALGMLLNGAYSFCYDIVSKIPWVNQKFMKFHRESSAV